MMKILMDSSEIYYFYKNNLKIMKLNEITVIFRTIANFFLK